MTRGNGYAVVTATGMKTEVGKISDMLTGNKSAKTPLDIELDKLGKAIIIAAPFAAVTVLIAGLLTDQPLVENAAYLDHPCSSEPFQKQCPLSQPLLFLAACGSWLNTKH